MRIVTPKGQECYKKVFQIKCGMRWETIAVLQRNPCSGYNYHLAFLFYGEDNSKEFGNQIIPIKPNCWSIKSAEKVAEKMVRKRLCRVTNHILTSLKEDTTEAYLKASEY